jgi:hypothetical protein
MTMERIRPAALRHGLATDKEIDAIIDGMHAFAQDPSTLVGMPCIVQVWEQVAVQAGLWLVQHKQAGRAGLSSAATHSR